MDHCPMVTIDTKSHSNRECLKAYIDWDRVSELDNGDYTNNIPLTFGCRHTSSRHHRDWLGKRKKTSRQEGLTYILSNVERRTRQGD
jgi:hypothetical protein